MQRIPTIGLISTWPVYQGTTIDRYAHTLIQGINAAAHESGCHLLLGCGFSITGKTPQRRNFWPVPGPDVDFVPVGPWNTDGLIIVPDELTDSQMQYVHDLLGTGFPVIFTTPEGPGPLVSVDNTQGIRDAFFHLHGHGHKEIAFIAGNIGGEGDSEERLEAYLGALKDAGIKYDERLIAFGKHRKEDGAIAMQKILDSGVSFSAVLASNDLSCLGAIDALSEHGLRIPQDVAIMGFDDILDARACSPSLSTVRHPTFSLGYQAVITLLEYVRGERKGDARVVVSPRLIIRQSCGCRPGHPELQVQTKNLHELAHEMAVASIVEARTSMLADLEEQSVIMLQALSESLTTQNANHILNAMDQALLWTEERGEDAHVWQAGTAILLQRRNAMITLAPDVDPSFAASLIDRVRLQISDQIQRQTTHSMLGYMDMMAQLGQLTAELLSAMSIEQSAEILSRHLALVGIKNALVALYEIDQEDPTAQGKVLFGAGFEENFNGLLFEPRKFPISQIYQLDEPLQLTILPLEVDDTTLGFVAFNAPNPELCAAIVHNLSAALRTSQLVKDALEGRRLAEEANRLKSRFLSMVSHELRTPLSLIIGLSEMSLSGKGCDVQDIEQINTSAQHLARLIGDVLDLASNEAGQLRILREPLDLAEVLGIAVKIGGELAREKGLEWQVELPAHGPWVLGDRTRLRQIMLNLISNAVKFTALGKVAFSVRSIDGEVCISVSDTGLGIAPAELETIFDEFYRSERTIETGIGGMGLGLVITRQLVEKHGGHIQVQSPGEFGSGSTFSITLPVLSSVLQDSDLSPALSLGDSTIILLAESGDITDQVEEHLRTRGFKLHICHLDQEVDWLSKVIRLRPAALILGERLAAREGWSIAGILRRQVATEHIPVLAYALDIDQNHGELLELNYLHKPLQPEELSRELLNVLPPAGEQQTVLVVDDDPGILAMHSRLVQQTGRRTLTAQNGKKALEILYKELPDLILLDLMMPEMDGFEVLSELRQRESTRDIPVIILTARLLSDADLERCNSGVASILSKGVFSDQETLDHIDAALERRSTLGGATRHLVRRAMTYIHKNYTDNLTRDNIAEHVGISSDYLTDCFRQELGITPITYIRRYRIHQACELLRNTNQSITQIAMNVGFSDSAHFTRTFLREMEVTPKAYRRKHQI
ncbi:MAG: substrate-binding domain-containing protein [Anaerolineaceae bacterium]|nr:substrate-binding domain-containing protein [Anaerolineaceae bacterium]